MACRRLRRPLQNSLQHFRLGEENKSFLRASIDAGCGIRLTLREGPRLARPLRHMTVAAIMAVYVNRSRSAVIDGMKK